MKNYLFQSLAKIFLPIIIIIVTHFVAIKYTNPIFYDSNEYLSIAENLHENFEFSVSGINTKDFNNFTGESPTRMRQPFYPIFLSIFYWAFNKNISIVLTIQLIINLLSFIYFIRIGKLVFGEEFYLKSNYILASYFPLWMLSASILTETLFTFLLPPQSGEKLTLSVTILLSLVIYLQLLFVNFH